MISPISKLRATTLTLGPGHQPSIQEFRRPTSDQTGQPNPVARCVTSAYCNLPRLRALALFGRRLAERADCIVMPASKNQHNTGSDVRYSTPVFEGMTLPVLDLDPVFRPTGLIVRASTPAPSWSRPERQSGPIVLRTRQGRYPTDGRSVRTEYPAGKVNLQPKHQLRPTLS